MTLKQITEMIAKELRNNGFEKDEELCAGLTFGFFYKEADVEYRTHRYFVNNVFFTGWEEDTYRIGKEVSVNEVYRRNGTQEDISIDIKLSNSRYYENDWSAGTHTKEITKVRVNTKMSEKQIINRINKILKAYDEA